MPPELPQSDEWPDDPDPADTPPWPERHGWEPHGHASGGWHWLGLFWICVLAVVAAVGVTLQVLGPPPGGSALRTASKPPIREAAIATRSALVGPLAPAGAGPARAGPVAAPDPALLEPLAADASGGVGLPRIAADGRAPMQVYAARFDPRTRQPRIAILIAGVGLDEAASEDAIRVLPAAISLAVSPYSAAPEVVAAAARKAGHEYLIALPLEPQGYAQNDPGQRALLTSATPALNAKRLDWVLSRVAGYVGATGALGDMRGERFAEVADQMDPVLVTLAARGLLYVDPRPGAARLPSVWSRSVDVVIDDPPGAAAIDARLADLEKRAHDTGTALGLIGAIRPITIEHLVAWAGNLAGRGYVLAPVSALVRAPEGSTQTVIMQAGPTPTGPTPSAVIPTATTTPAPAGVTPAVPTPAPATQAAAPRPAGAPDDGPPKDKTPP